MHAVESNVISDDVLNPLELRVDLTAESDDVDDDREVAEMRERLQAIRRNPPPVASAKGIDLADYYLMRLTCGPAFWPIGDSEWKRLSTGQRRYITKWLARLGYVRHSYVYDGELSYAGVRLDERARYARARRTRTAAVRQRTDSSARAAPARPAPTRERPSGRRGGSTPATASFATVTASISSAAAPTT